MKIQYIDDWMHCKRYKLKNKLDQCLILVGIENSKWHLSISNQKRYPHWDEIKFARYQLMPLDKDIGMILPPPSEFVNIHENCFHLWELK